MLQIHRAARLRLSSLWNFSRNQEIKMRVELAALKMSHVRDFLVDPQEHEDAGALIASIKENDFWSGIVVNKLPNGDLEVIAGHKRTWAAMQAGITHADVHVGKYDDRQAIRIYATENITQRGATAGLAMAGAVASAVRYLVKAILKGDKDSMVQIYTIGGNGTGGDLEHLQGNITSEKGIGWKLVRHFYNGIEGINDSVVQHHMANLKASGDYARIVKEVTEEIEREGEHAIELAELERQEAEAEKAKEPAKVEKVKARKVRAKAKQVTTKAAGQKAKEAAAKKKVTFDLKGVGKYLKGEHQLRVFREMVEKESMQKHLPFEKQADLAAQLVEYANKNNKGELTGTFIRDNLSWMMLDAAQEQGRLNQQARKEAEEQDVRLKWTNLAHHFARNVGGINSDGILMLQLLEKFPDTKFNITKELTIAVKYAVPTINKLAEKLKIK